MLKKSSLVSALLGLSLISGCQNGYVSTEQSQAVSLSILAQESQKAVLAQESLKNARVDQMKNLQVKQAKQRRRIVCAARLQQLQTLCQI